MEEPAGEDFGSGVAIERLPDGAMLQGKVGTEEVLLVRRGSQIFAVGPKCTHYGGPLAEGLIVGDELRCPLHHAAFNLHSGEVARAPAFDPIPCWRVERIGDRVFVRDRLSAATSRAASARGKPPSSVVIVGGGGAGLSAAATLRREGYEGPVTIVSADDSAPYDRPNLSKDYLAGTAPDDWMPLRSPEYYADRRINLLLKSRVTAVDTVHKRVQLESGQAYDFDRLLLATGADPVTLTIPGAAESQVYYLRTFADSRRLAERAASAKQVVVVGASFIGLEVAAALRARGISVHVVAFGKQPLERVMGPEVGLFVRGLHESQGVVFHMDDSVIRLDGRKVLLKSGAILDADFLVLGVGVRPSTALAEQAGLRMDRGVLVDEFLETSVPGIFAAGDIARWPYAHSAAPVRVEHWVVAERQGQVAARNMLGYRERYDAVPFFWTQQYAVPIKYVGHAERWDSVEISGSLEAKECTVRYNLAGRTLAAVTIGRDLESLQLEAAEEVRQRQGGPGEGHRASAPE